MQFCFVVPSSIAPIIFDGKNIILDPNSAISKWLIGKVKNGYTLEMKYTTAALERIKTLSIKSLSTDYDSGVNAWLAFASWCDPNNFLDQQYPSSRAVNGKAITVQYGIANLDFGEAMEARITLFEENDALLFRMSWI